ncbi:MAG: Gfo/Idh/MocA family oxidoreductase [Planctomycetia bacterium]|nr:Gfo/Idh/MocA family oxidoreductase [Planctomycetia bacterium]
MKQKMSRRYFLGRVSAATLLSSQLAAFPAPGLAQDRSPSSRLNIVNIGINGMGGGNLNSVKGENIIALCDINEENLEIKGKEFPDAKRYFDFRTLFDEVKDIDACVVSTPDHTHAVATIAALKRGIHCYTEKPLAHEINEIRAMQKLAAEKKLHTQMGTVIHATDNYRRVVELIQAKAIGEVTEVHVWCQKGWGGFAMPTTTVPCPDTIHWDQWIGPAPMIPYDPCYQPARWRGYWPFGTGTFGDMACHLMDLPFWALNLGYPKSVEATCPTDMDPMLCPLDVTARYEFELTDPDGKTRTLPLTWYDGVCRPEVIAEKGLENLGMGIIFVGTDGLLEADYGTIRLYPEAKFADYKRPEPSIAPSLGHHAEWLESIRQDKPLSLCEFQYAGRLSEAVQLGAVSLRAGKKKLLYDAANMKITNCPEANALLARDYRDGWSLD